MLAYESTTTRLSKDAPPSCAVIQDLLPLYIEDEVGTTTRDFVAKHLATCDHCTGYLAGSQSARAQLRQDRAARSAVLQSDAPAQQTLRRGQRMFRALFWLGVAFTEIVVSGAVWMSLDPWTFNVGPMLALMAFAGLVVLAPRKKFDLVRWLVAAAGAVSAGVGVSGMLSFSSSPDLRFFAMLLLMASLLGFRYFVWDRD